MSSFTLVNNRNSLPSFQQMENAGWDLNNVSDNQSSATSAMAQPIKKEYLCNVEGCGKSFNDQSNFRRHKKIHEPSENKYLCKAEGCGKSFGRSDNLNKHKTKHNH